MTKNHLLDAMGYIDPKLIAEAAPDAPRKPKTNTLWIRTASLAACICLIVAVGILLSPLRKPTSNLSSYSFSWSSISYLFGESFTEEELFAESALISTIQDKSYASYLPNRVLSEAYVGEKIDSVSVKACMVYFGENTETEIEYYTADVFLIKGVDRSAAVCLKYTAEGKHYTTAHYYSWINGATEFSELSSFYEAFYAEEYFSIGQCKLDKIDSQDGSILYQTYRMSDSDTEELKAFLLSLNGTRVELTTKEAKESLLNGCTRKARLSCTLAPAGLQNSTVTVLENGYLIQSLGTETGIFKIGAEPATAILDFISENGECIASISSEDDEIMEMETSFAK